MLKSLEGNNYQSHEKTRVEFSPKITAIIGSSDAGKTALLRMLRWVVFNRPLGKSMIRRNSRGGCSVTIENDTGFVTKKRDSGGTSYNVNWDEFDKVGADVPVQVTEQLNLGDINIQNQLEPHFLVLQSGGQIASYINKVLKMDILSTAVSLANSRIKELQNSIELTEKHIKLCEDDLEAYANLDSIEEKIKEYTELQKECDKLVDSEMEIASDIILLNELDDQLGKYSLVLEYEKTIQDFEEGLDEIDQLDSDIAELDGHLELLASVEDQWVRAEKNLKLKTTAMDEALISYREILEEMGNCPWCGQELTDEAIEFKKEGLA